MWNQVLTQKHLPDKGIVDDGEAVSDDGSDDRQDEERLPAVPVGEGACEDGVGEGWPRPHPLVLDGELVLEDLNIVLDRLVGVCIEVEAEGVVVAQFQVADLQVQCSSDPRAP